MELSKDKVISLIAELWQDKYPLVKTYFGIHLSHLVQALLADEPFEERFVKAAFDPVALERRLQRIEAIEQTSQIVSEVGDITEPKELDRRLMDAWAELRTIDQINKEGFISISKVTETADLTATHKSRGVAFQVKRINSSLDGQVQRRNADDKRDTNPFGEISDIYARLSGPLGWYFWEALEEKNGKFRNWTDSTYSRCIVIVSGDDELQDSMVRHIACKEIRDGITLLIQKHFEELLWLPDCGNGAWFKIDPITNEITCLVDWGDSPDRRINEDKETVNRRQADLNCDIPRLL